MRYPINTSRNAVIAFSVLAIIILLLLIIRIEIVLSFKLKA